jgi:hypothetical protein
LVIYSSAARDSAPFPSAEGKRPVSLSPTSIAESIHQRHYQLGCKLHLGRRHGAGFKAVGKSAHVHGGDRDASADSIGFLAAAVAATRRAPVTAFGRRLTRVVASGPRPLGAGLLGGMPISLRSLRFLILAFDRRCSD